MAISRYDYVPGQPIANTYVPLPYEELASSLAHRQHSYDVGEALTHANQDNFLRVAALPIDIERRKQLLDSYRKEASEKFDQAKGDYSQLGAFAKEQAQRIKSDMTYGQLGAIHNNALAHQKYIEGLDELAKNGKITAEDKKGLAHISLNNYTGVGEGLDGNYNKYNGIEAAHYVDLAEEADKRAKGWMANQVSRGLVEEKGGKFYKYGTTEEVDPNEIYNNVYNALASDSKNMNYARQKAMIDLYGKNAQQKDYLNHIYDQFHNPSTYVANKYGYRKTTDHYMDNPQWSLDYKHGLDNQVDPYKFEIDTPANITPQGSINKENKDVKLDGREITYSPALTQELGEGGRFSRAMTKFLSTKSLPNSIGNAVQELFRGSGSGDFKSNKNLTPEDKKLIKIVENKYGLWNPTKEEVASAIKQYADEVRTKSQSNKVNILNDIAVANDKRFDQSNDEFNQIVFAPNKEGEITDNGTLANLNIIDAQKGTEVNGSELIGKKGNIVGALNNNNPYGPGWRQAQIDGKTYYIKGSDQEQMKNLPEWSFHQANYNLLGRTMVPMVINGQQVNIPVEKSDNYDKKGVATSSNYTFKDPVTGQEVELQNAPNSEVAFQNFYNYISSRNK